MRRARSFRRARERTAGPYRVRVEYQAAGAGGHEHSGHGSGAAGGHSHGAAQAARTGHLMVFVADATTGEAVPYLPVSTVVAASGAASTLFAMSIARTLNVYEPSARLL